MFILVAVAYFAVTQVSGNVANADIKKNDTESPQSGGETDEMIDLDSDLSEMETGDNFASVKN